MIVRWVRRHKVGVVLSDWSYLHHELSRAGLDVPRHLGYACLCLGERSHEMAGVVVNLTAVGAQAVSTLAMLLRVGRLGPPEFPLTTYVEGSWYDGPTIVKPKGRPRKKRAETKAKA